MDNTIVAARTRHTSLCISTYDFESRHKDYTIVATETLGRSLWNIDSIVDYEVVDNTIVAAGIIHKSLCTQPVALGLNTRLTPS